MTNMPSLFSQPQLYNFVRFCEMLLKAPCKVKRIHLLTSQDEVGCSTPCDKRIAAKAVSPDQFTLLFHCCCCVLQADSSQQSSALAELKESLSEQGVTLDLQYSSTIHDREIRYSKHLSLTDT